MQKLSDMSKLIVNKAYFAALLISAASLSWLAPAAAADVEAAASKPRGKVVIFASEKMGNEWIASHFNTVHEGAASYNQCEISLGQTLEGMGFENLRGDLSRADMAKAKRLMTVFVRYKDMSTLANDTAVKASDIIDGDADTVLLCTVEIGPKKKKWRRRSKVESCTEVRCKAVATSDAKRLATHTVEKCSKTSDDPGAGIEAIRHMCTEAGKGIGLKMIQGEKI